ncbi:hypothetical protein ACWC9U_36095, partial [Streptomyces sp. 900116325]
MNKPQPPSFHLLASTTFLAATALCVLKGAHDLQTFLELSETRLLACRPVETAGPEVPPAHWTTGVYAAGMRFCLSRYLVSSGVTY